MSRHARFLGLLVALLVIVGLLAGAWTASAQGTPSRPAVQPGCYKLGTGIPFAWLRFQPSSFAGFGITVYPGYTMSLVDATALTWDGTQWWAYVWPDFAPGHGYYWVEWTSLTPCGSAPPTPVPTTPAPPTPVPPSPTPVPGAAPWVQGYTVRVRTSVPFVWMRGQPVPWASPILTVVPGEHLTIAQGSPTTDTYGQWWWPMRDSRYGVTGWVEQNLVELVSGVPTPVPPTGDWKVGDVVRVRFTIPFSWLRNQPNSTSGFSYTAGPGHQLILLQGPLNDGVQNWWQVSVPYSSVQGWVEANSLELVRRGA